VEKCCIIFIVSTKGKKILKISLNQQQLNGMMRYRSQNKIKNMKQNITLATLIFCFFWNKFQAKKFFVTAGKGNEIYIFIKILIKTENL